MTIIGQNKLKAILDTYTKQTLPKTLMFIGDQGCGKHTFATYIAKKFNLDMVEIDTNVNTNDLDAFLLRTLDTLYVIDLSNFSEKYQNQFLKFIEEPSKTTFVLLLVKSEVAVLPTILNRCTKYRFEEYSQNEIELILNTKINELAFKIFRTPGKLLNLTETSFNEVLMLGKTFIAKLANTIYGNTLVIATKINYKDLYSKIDFYLFFDVIEYLALEDFKINNNKQSLTIFKVTNQFKQYINQQYLIKETLMLNYLTTVWEALQT